MRNLLKLMYAMVLATLFVLLGNGQSGPPGETAPLPEKIVTAKTIFLMNETGQPKLGDAVYKQIKTWNQWKIATDRAQADLLLIVTNKGKTFYLNVRDARTEAQLWSVRTTMQGKLWRTWDAVAKDLLSDIRKRYEVKKP